MIKIVLPIFTAMAVSAAPISTVYQQRCANCHGLHGDKIAIGKSRTIKGMQVEYIEKTLHDYASGTKPTMPVVQKMKQYFLNTYSKEQVHELAEYVNKM